MHLYILSVKTFDIYIFEIEETSLSKNVKNFKNTMTKRLFVRGVPFYIIIILDIIGTRIKTYEHPFIVQIFI